MRNVLLKKLALFPFQSSKWNWHLRWIHFMEFFPFSWWGQNIVLSSLLDKLIVFSKGSSRLSLKWYFLEWKLIGAVNRLGKGRNSTAVSKSHLAEVWQATKSVWVGLRRYTFLSFVNIILSGLWICLVLDACATFTSGSKIISNKNIRSATKKSSAQRYLITVINSWDFNLKFWNSTHSALIII